MNSEVSPWGDKEKKNWLDEQVIQRSYLDDVVSKIDPLRKIFDVTEYGRLSYDPARYPLFIIKNLNFENAKKTILITGGVHGYETSGVHGALSFLEKETIKYSEKFNIIVAPCISPWGYETINRWNPDTVDPNRSFFKNGPAQECNLFMAEIEAVGINVFAHIDLHETTNTDNSIFRPALEKRDGVTQDVWDIPDGFYLVGDSEKPAAEFQKSMIDAVREITHIAPADEKANLIGEPITQEGVINYAIQKLNLCTGFSEASYCSTTEVYPDSSRVNSEDCIKAQVAAIRGGLDYLARVRT